jgi:transposase
MFTRRPTDRIARETLDRIAKLYEIEELIRERPLPERETIRKERVLPLLESLQRWLIDTVRTLSKKSELALAIRYAKTLNAAA